MRTLVIGGSGLVGSNLVETFETNGHEVCWTYYSADESAGRRLDKTDNEETNELVCEFEPEVIIDTAAFHAVDDCDIERDRAWTVNAAGTRNVAVAANEVGAHLLYLSTDYVFQGLPSEAPYTETDATYPVNYYGQAKYAAEQAAKIAEASTILRPSVIYGLASANFVTWVLGELEEGNEVNIVDDQTSTPTFAPDLARACLILAEGERTGLFHATGPERLSRFEFTNALASVYGFDQSLISPTSSEELGQTAPRPEDSSLDSTKLYEMIGYQFRTPTEAFQQIASKDAD